MKTQVLLVLLLIAFGVTFTHACIGKHANDGDGNGDGGDGGDGDGGDGDGGDGGTKTEGGPDDGGDGGDGGEADPFADKMGTDASATNTFEGDNSGAVSSGEQLACDFDGACCWANEPVDDSYEWRTADAQPDADVFATHFNAPPPADGTYLVTASNDADGTMGANLVSCTVTCAKDAVLVTLDHWRTGATTLRACTMPADGGDLEHCVDFPVDDSPGPSLVELPAGDNFRVVIVGAGHTSSTGDIIIIDNLDVQFEPCDGAASPSSGDAGAMCSALQCNFETDLCAYTASAEDAHPFAAVERLGPQTVGARRPSEGMMFAGANAYAGESVTAVVTVDADADYVLSFDYWEVTDGMTARVCVDDDCAFETPMAVTAAERVWRQGQVDVPKGAKTVSLGAVNEGTNIGMIGYDNLVLLKADGKTNAC